MQSRPTWHIAGQQYDRNPTFLESTSFLAKIPRRKVYRGRSEEGEQTLAYVIHAANKGLAHTARSFLRHHESSGLLEIAFRGVNALMVNYFFRPTGLEPPTYTLQSRKLNA